MWVKVKMDRRAAPGRAERVQNGSRSEAVWGPEAEQACGLRVEGHNMSFRPKTRLLRFTPLRDASSPAPSLSALGDLSFSSPAHRARQRPERGAGGCLSASRADAG